ncbi:helix-turn-helix domain-containing protein [Vibrio cyclitrophicus]|uniref:helix-turn-helix domain-containing protein n=1 Tax=Vibrio cyclitrophicus TaxID=47951 RepID=UPI000C828D76|nr:helix-turn-helix domain-containing protein [Vibrio cyclitrophicus]PMH57609.1 transcriptional regulator [Vibrio cyclitrophicus]
MCVSLILSFIPLKTGSPISKLVLLKLADNADARGVCFPSLNYLAQYCEVSVRTVKRHINELEKQGFVKRIKRFDDSGRQRSNLYQLRLPSGSHIQQADLDQAARALAQEDLALEQEDSDKTDQHKSDLNTHSPNLPISDHSDTHQGDSRSNTESDRSAHIIFHKEHKTELNLKSGILDGADVLNTPNRSEEPDTSISTSTSKPKSKTKNEAVIDLLTKEGCAPIYHEFYEILKRTYPKLDVLQELHAMQAWLYINPDKRKPFEHIGHFVNGWLRRSAQAQTKRGLTPAFKKTRGVKQSQSQTQASKQGTAKPANPIKALDSMNAAGSRTTAGLTNTDKPTTDVKHAHSIQNDQTESKSLEPKQPTPVTQALADYKAKSTTNPFEERIRALIQSRSTSTDNQQ